MPQHCLLGYAGLLTQVLSQCSSCIAASLNFQLAGHDVMGIQKQLAPAAPLAGQFVNTFIWSDVLASPASACQTSKMPIFTPQKTWPVRGDYLPHLRIDLSASHNPRLSPIPLSHQSLPCFAHFFFLPIRKREGLTRAWLPWFSIWHWTNLCCC